MTDMSQTSKSALRQRLDAWAYRQGYTDFESWLYYRWPMQAYSAVSQLFDDLLSNRQRRSCVWGKGHQWTPCHCGCGEPICFNCSLNGAGLRKDWESYYHFAPLTERLDLWRYRPVRFLGEYQWTEEDWKRQEEFERLRWGDRGAPIVSIDVVYDSKGNQLTPKGEGISIGYRDEE